MHKGDVLVSVCISVYNGMGSLGQCLDSVISQGVGPMEVVLVDDGSTDDTLRVMREYERRCAGSAVKVKVIEQRHLGLAQGRCTGVMNATGDFVTFLDADDRLLEGAYKKVLQRMRHARADVYEFQTMRDDYYARSPYSGVMDAKRVLTDYFNGVGMPVNYWLRWFKRELLPRRVFPQGVSLHEDVYAFPCILNEAKSIAYIEEPLHVHARNEASIMGRYQALRGTRAYFEGQRALLGTIPHIVGNIGPDVIEREYKEPFARYVARISRNAVLADAGDVTYEERIDAVASALGRDMSRREVERIIERGLDGKGRLNRAIRVVGLRNAYRLHGLLRQGHGRSQ